MMTTRLLDPISLDPSDSYVPYVRRRNTPAQLSALHQLFEVTPRPTRAQRQALSKEIGMEFKSVTNWFQNRRQTSRKKSSNENNPPKTRLTHSPVRHPYRRSKTPLDRSQISLDRIAALSERPSLTLQSNSLRLPLTPRKSNAKQKNPPSPSELWTHMLSSPAVPLSAPDPEEARLVALSSQEKILYPLEWACLKARQKKWVDEDGVEPEVNNLESGAVVSLQSDGSNLCKKNALLSRPSMTPQFKDVEAAITLLGFKMRS